MSAIIEHEDLGRVAQGHLPLWVIARYFPDEFEQIKDTWSCAITRDPLERFRSAMAQRAREFLGVRLEDLDSGQLRRELELVFDHLEKHPDLPQAEFCHFTRQTDFVFLDDEQVVGNVYPLERISVLLAVLARKSGVQATEQFVNRSEGAADGHFGRAARAGWQRVKPLLPGPARRFLRTHLRPLVVKAPETLTAHLEDEKISSFIRDFYAGDFELHANARASVPAG